MAKHLLILVNKGSTVGELLDFCNQILRNTSLLREMRAPTVVPASKIVRPATQVLARNSVQKVSKSDYPQLG